MHDLAEDGADIIGGCCGTTPEYIRQMVLKTADVVHKKNASIEEEITEKKTAMMFLSIKEKKEEN